MKKNLVFMLLILLSVKMFPTNNWSLANAIEPDIIWLEKEYDNVDNFSEGLAFVLLNYKYGFIDKTGKEVIPLKYDFEIGRASCRERV